MYRYRVAWSIPNAGPSVSTFFMDNDGVADLSSAAASIRAFFLNRAALFPNEVTLVFDDAVDVLDPTTGELGGTFPVSQPPDVVGTGAGVWAAGSGVRVDWQTVGFLNGRRVRGRLFLVPSVVGAFGTDGRVLPAQVTATNSAATTLIAGLEVAATPLVVWHRPGPGGAGATYPVTAPVTATLAATLRGRKY